METINMDLCGTDYTNFIKSFAKNRHKKKILDIGCCEGNITVLLKGDDNDVFATDIVDARDTEFKNDFSFFISSKDSINFSDNYFDLVTSFDVIEHTFDDQNFVKEIFRVLKDGGEVLTITPNKYRLSNILKMLVSFKKISYPMRLGEGVGPYGECIHVREYTAKQLESLFENIGFREVEVTPFWFGLRYKILEKFRIKNIIPFPLSFATQYFIVHAVK